MIVRILERFREVGNIQFQSYTKPMITVEDAMRIVQEVAKEYESRTCVNCKYETTPGDFEPCCVCRNACSDDCFEPKPETYQKGE